MRAMRYACVCACARTRKMSARYARPRASLRADNSRRLLTFPRCEDSQLGTSVEKSCNHEKKSCKKFWRFRGKCLPLQA